MDYIHALMKKDGEIHRFIVNINVLGRAAEKITSGMFFPVDCGGLCTLYRVDVEGHRYNCWEFGTDHGAGRANVVKCGSGNSFLRRLRFGIAGPTVVMVEYQDEDREQPCSIRRNSPIINVFKHSHSDGVKAWLDNKLPTDTIYEDDHDRPRGMNRID